MAAASLPGAASSLGSQVGALTRALQMEAKMGRPRKTKGYKRNPAKRPTGGVDTASKTPQEDLPKLTENPPRLPLVFERLHLSIRSARGSSVNLEIF